MKKIGIIGLLPNQAAAIEEVFPNLTLVNLPKERERQARSFGQNFSKVVLMTKFISHSTFNSIPNHKRVLVAGGMTDLRRTLETLASDPEFTKPPTKPLVEVPALPPQVYQETIMPNKKGNREDWSLLRAAELNDVLYFERPKGADGENWKTRVSNIRAYYKRVYGIVTSAEFLNGTTVSLKVTEVRKKEPVSEETQESNVGLAAIWTSFVTSRSASGLSMKQVLKDGDEFLEAFKKRFT